MKPSSAGVELFVCRAVGFPSCCALGIRLGRPAGSPRVPACARPPLAAAPPRSRRSRRPDRSPRAPLSPPRAVPGADRNAEAIRDIRVGAMRVGFVGWRGMVGSVLMERMRAERDFDLIEPEFFSASVVGGKGPDDRQGDAAGQQRARPQGAHVARRDRHVPGRRLHERDRAEASRAQAGRASGSTPRPRCGWPTTR